MSLNPIIILVAPQLGENIGASARAMKNFGLTKLRIVSPRDGWPNPKADSMSVGAIDIIQNAQIYDTLLEAIADIECLYATTAQPRDMNKNYLLTQDLGRKYPQNQKVAIMFGRENCGLTNEEIAHANMILSIKTKPDFSSLNIAHAVALVAYECYKTVALPEENSKLDNEQIVCTRGELEYFFDHLFNELEANKFFKVPEKYPHMTQNIRNIFTRIDKLSQNELQTLRGIISSLSKKT